MIGGGREYTFYFAWVQPDTPWDPSLARVDVPILDLEISEKEGEIPTATIEIANPRTGPLMSGKLLWAWISVSIDGGTPWPLLFSRLYAIPTDLLNNTIKFTLMARDTDYIDQKQRVAETLKVLPMYDKLFFTTEKRDDPDAILEGWSGLYQVNRVSSKVFFTDIITGEDGTVYFDASDVFYDSVQMRWNQSALVAVNVKMDVSWQQQYRDYFYVNSWAFPTLGGDPFVGEWPKSGTSLGGGWSTGISWAGERDPPIPEQINLERNPGELTTKIQYSWTNTDKTHTLGDVMSINVSYSPPWGQFVKIREILIPGIVDLTNVDDTGQPSPINQPAHLEIDWFCWKDYALNFEGKQSLATLSLVYNADRKRSESLEMTIQADVQPVLVDPLVTEDTETISLKSGDLSIPIIDLLNWHSIAGGVAVTEGEMVFPDNPLVPGQTSSQICVVAGNTGDTIPTFSNIPGVETIDNTVTWASLGVTPPPENSQDWVRFARVSVGTMILPKPISAAPDINSIDMAGKLNFPPTGVPLAKYTILANGNGGPGTQMYEVTSAGIFGGLSTAPATMQTFTNPTGQFMYLCIQAGETGEFHVTFDETPGSTTTDGTVIWKNIGPVSLPIGGWPGATPASAYFPSPRGQLSLQHGLCRARAKLRKRARNVQVDFETRFEVAAMLSCRMNGFMPDKRLPGGFAFGKVIAYKLRANGDTGKVYGSVTLGVATGKDFGAVPTDAGVGVYASPGYMQPGYQQLQTTVSGANGAPIGGVSFPLPVPASTPTLPPTLPPAGTVTGRSYWSPGPDIYHGDEMGYAPPIAQTVDDGLTFPAHQSDLIMKSEWHGIASTEDPLVLAAYNSEINTAIIDAINSVKRIQYFSVPNISGTGGGPVETGSITLPASNFADIQNAVNQAVIKSLDQGNRLWYELVLKPLTNGPFAAAYQVETTKLGIPQGMNLEAGSSG